MSSERVLVESDGNGVFYYREHPPGDGGNAVVPVNLGPVDWLDLAKQKHALVTLLWADKNREHPLWGLVSFLDHVQDTANAAGLPVVWATEDDPNAEKT